MKKKVIISITITSIMAISLAVGAYAATKLTIIVNGKVTNTQAKVIDGVTYLPLRDIGTLLGASIQYDKAAKTVEVISSNGTVPEVLTIIKPTNPIGNSRTNPVPVGLTAPVDIDNGTELYTASIGLDEVIRGDKAWEMISEANQFNDPAPDGSEYLVAKIKVKINKNKKIGTAIRISDYDFMLVSSKGKDYKRASVVVPQPKLEASLYEGALDTGYAVFIVDKNDINPLITFGRNYDGSGGFWLKT